MRWNIIRNAVWRIFSPFHWWRSAAPVKDGNSEPATDAGPDDTDDQASPQFEPATNAGPPEHWLERIRLVAPHLLSSLTSPASVPKHPGGTITRPVREASTPEEFESQTESQQQSRAAAIVEVPTPLQSNRGIASNSVVQDQASNERSEHREDAVEYEAILQADASTVRSNVTTISPFPSEQTASRRDVPQIESTLEEAAIASRSIAIRDPFDVAEVPKRRPTETDAKPTTPVERSADRIEAGIESAPTVRESSASSTGLPQPRPVSLGEEFAQIDLKARWAGIVLPPDDGDSMRPIRPTAEGGTIHFRSDEPPRGPIAASPSPIAPTVPPARHQKPVDSLHPTPAPVTESSLSQLETRSAPTILHRESTSPSRTGDPPYQQNERSHQPASGSNDSVRQSSRRDLGELEIDRIPRSLWPELPDSIAADDEFVGDDLDRHHRHRLDLEQKGRRWKE